MSNAPVSLLSNGTSSDTDIYAPLDGNQQSIRPFRIIPGTGLLNLELKQVCLESDECPPFAALSYMWGENPTHQEIIINGNAFRVTQNAFRFLETLRQHQELRINNGMQGLPRSYPESNNVPRALGTTNWSGDIT